jgi:hypothetical protein
MAFAIRSCRDAATRRRGSLWQAACPNEHLAHIAAMGIRFHCPNGHKLNVKAFLAGKRAICPKCGAKVLVPSVSENEEVLHEEAKPLEASAVLRQAPASAIGSAATAGQMTATASPATEVHPVGVRPVHAAAGPSAPATSGAGGANGAESKDPINEAPTAVWYVRPTTGGQFGPAAANVMRTWLAEGRVGATSLVWRAGWPEWQTAADVFPQLSQGLIAGQPALPVGTSVSSANTPAAAPGSDFFAEGLIGPAAGDRPQLGLETGALSSRYRRRRRSQNVTIVASVVLVLVAIVLIVVLIYVLNHQGSPTEATLRQTPANAVEHGLSHDRTDWQPSEGEFT